jgi:hypothetical protein
MARLGEAHIEQIKTLHAEGKAAPEIVEIMKQTYPGVKFATSQVYYVLKTAKKTKGGGMPKVKRHYKKHAKVAIAAAPDGTPVEQVVKDIAVLIEDIKVAYAVVIRNIRIDLLRSRAEVYAILTGAGIDVPESKIK